MTTQLEAMKMMVAAMEEGKYNTRTAEAYEDAIAAGRAAIEAAKKVEPVAWISTNTSSGECCIARSKITSKYEGLYEWQPLYLHPPSAEIRKDAEQPKVAATRDEFLFWFNVTCCGSGVDEYWAYDMCQQWAKYAAMREKQP